MNDPTTVPATAVHAAFTALGITADHENITRVEIGPERITVVRHRRDADGQLFAAGLQAATTTTTIGINWSDDD